MISIVAISVKQPRANMIASGEKTIETRTWRTTYRGDLLIVSSRYPKIEPAGKAVAVCRLVDCRPMRRADEKAACCEWYEFAYAWVLNDARAIEPFPVRGRLGFFKVTVDEAWLRTPPKTRRLF
ncbi:MAG TPA: ASCH domain-containing protein [Acidobacteriaceae bacterium]|nr:ASCH domain-containing protein [Acidobacteriaceae bacterium]